MLNLVELVPSLLASGHRGPSLWMPEQASTIAPSIDFLFNFITWICYFFFALILVLLIAFVVLYRRTPDQRGGHSAGPTHNTPLELTWTIVPLLLVIAIFYLGFRSYMDLSTPPNNAYEINVTAWQWGWLFKYPNGATSDDLYVPSERPVRLVMRSNDVIHSLFIPDFRVKKDVVPGRYTALWFEAVRPTEGDDFHWLFCTEYCGNGHSNMNRKVFVLPEAEFHEKVEQLGRYLDEIPDEELYFRAGPKLYARCSQCHSLDGTPGIGPTWKGFWERLEKGDGEFADGTTYASAIGPGKEFETPEDYVRNSILNPGNHLVKGYGNAMPTFQGQLSDRAIDALIGFMKNLDEFDAKGNWLEGAAPSN